MGDGERSERLRERIDGLWKKVRKIEGSDSQEAETKPVKRCSYCREPGHYRPTCPDYAADLAELHRADNELAEELEKIKRQLAETQAAKQEWIELAFEQQDEIMELRRQLSSMGISARPTR